MTDKDALAYRFSFVSYQLLLHRGRLACFTKTTERNFVYHFLSAICRGWLRALLESDLELSQYGLRKEFKGFMAQAIKLSEAFQLVDNGTSSRRRKNRDSRDRRNKDNASDSEKGRDVTSCKGTSNGRNLHVCLYGPYEAKCYRHYLKDCTACIEEEKKKLFKHHAKLKAATRPSKSARSQKGAHTTRAEDKVVGSVNVSRHAASSSFVVSFHEGEESLTGKGRADDGSDESTVSTRIAECAVLNGIGKMTKIAPISLQVALEAKSDTEKFVLSRTWTAQRAALKLSAHNLALVDVNYFAADANLAAQDLLIGSPVIRQLGVDAKNLLVKRQDLLDGTDCLALKLKSYGGNTGRVS